MEYSLTAEHTTVAVVVSATVVGIQPDTALVLRFGATDVRRLGLTETGKIRAVFAHFITPGETVVLQASVEPANADGWIDGVDLLGIEAEASEPTPPCNANVQIKRRSESPKEVLLEITVTPDGDHRYLDATVRLIIRPLSLVAFISSTIAAFVGDRAPVVVEMSTPFGESVIDLPLEVGSTHIVRIAGTQPFAVGDVRCIALSEATSR